jgi:hypothetical protein
MRIAVAMTAEAVNGQSGQALWINQEVSVLWVHWAERMEKLRLIGRARGRQTENLKDDLALGKVPTQHL